MIICPDAGVSKKIDNFNHPALRANPKVFCSKHRDTVTGALSGFEAHCGDLEKRPCVIVDDICDGGGTFLGLAEELKHKNAGPLYLAVTHGIFSKGLDELLKVFSVIYTTDSFQFTANEPFVVHYKIMESINAKSN